ncbi:uncharacterized protein LOC142616956 [Castanea sativa]|uniref:uncharacterized protein LOC142616956 n=1 Tax=Castanea sativa TaxID=21020 RepID=UPI003F651E77
MALFHEEEANAISYRVAQQVLKDGRGAESSNGSYGKRVWAALWKLKIPNKIKVFGWRACHDIRRQDVWAGSVKILQKGCTDQYDLLHLLEYLLDRLSLEEVEVFFTQAWFIWSRRNSVLHGGKFIDPGTLNRRAAEYLQEYKHAQEQLDAEPVMQNSREAWEPPPESAVKLNFDAAVFSEVNRTGVGAIIHNYKSEVMAAMSARGPAVHGSEKGELLACRKAIEFAIDAGFSRLVIEGDNVNVIKAISSQAANISLLGNVVEDIKHLIRGLQWMSTSHIRQSGNKVAHVLAQYARIIVEDLYWIEDSPPPVIEQLYQDVCLL